MGEGDAIRRLLEGEHRRLLGLLAEVRQACDVLEKGGGTVPGELKGLVGRFGRELALHLRREETAVWPKDGGERGGTARALHRHDALRDRYRAFEWHVLFSTRSFEERRTGLLDAARLLAGDVQDHFREEESALFPALQERGGEETTRVFHRMRALEEDFARARPRGRGS